MSTEIVAFPALEAKIGDWTYYVTTMKMGELVEKISYAHKLYQPTTLDEIIQRDLTSRGAEISDYLVRQKERFFSAMVIAVADGDPKFQRIDVIDPIVKYAKIDGLGLLTFDGTQRYFALDGQHRLSGIKEALVKKESLKNEQVTVIFVPHKHATRTERGRTRRLFTTLNRYAKAISKKDAIVMDEDDAVAIVTRQLVQSYSLFKDKRLSIKNGKGIPPTDHTAFTNIITVYDVNEIVLKTQWHIDKSFKQQARPIGETEKMYSRVTEYWKSLSDSLPEVKKLHEDNYLIDNNLRSRAGGHLAFRPVGLTLIARAYSLCFKEKEIIAKFFTRLPKVNWSIVAYPWRGTVWHSGLNKIDYKKENELIAARVLAYMLGMSLESGEVEKLLTDYRATNKEDSTVSLPAKIH